MADDADRVSVEPLRPADGEALLRFERENRGFFERSIPGRGDGYYRLATVVASIEANLEERRRGSDFMYAIRDASGEIAGRINLVNVQRGPVQSAEIGYRIGERHNGLGYATRAVDLVAREAFDTLKLHRLEAATSPANIGSQIVLIRNRFEFFGRARSSFRVHDVWHDSVLFERVNSTSSQRHARS